MKKVLFLFALALAGSSLSAQNCTSCTITISGTDPNPHLVGAGTTLCITSTGIAMGPIAVTGGTLCNSGTITNNAISVSSGTFNNYGIVSLDSISVSGSGVINNYAGTTSITAIAFGVDAGGTLNNYSTIDCDSIGVRGGTFTNNGTLNVNYNMGTAMNAVITNNGTIGISGSFGNSSGAAFTNTCLVDVSGNWANSATIKGPTNGGCGRWVVDGVTLNSGIFGVTGKCDMCDQGNPPGGFDANSGTLGPIGTNVTFCVCTAQPCTASSTGELNAGGQVKHLRPNPASNTCQLQVSAMQASEMKITVISIMGQTVMTQSAFVSKGENEIVINTSALDAGVYYIFTEISGKRSVPKKLVIAR